MSNCFHFMQNCEMIIISICIAYFQYLWIIMQIESGISMIISTARGTSTVWIIKISIKQKLISRPKFLI